MSTGREETPRETVVEPLAEGLTKERIRSLTYQKRRADINERVNSKKSDLTFYSFVARGRRGEGRNSDCTRLRPPTTVEDT